ncbi:hypothetical protein ACP70R_021916 [Stipagrostis hirtigluma subsp. patula]
MDATEITMSAAMEIVRIALLERWAVLIEANRKLIEAGAQVHGHAEAVDASSDDQHEGRLRVDPELDGDDTPEHMPHIRQAMAAGRLQVDDAPPPSAGGDGQLAGAARNDGGRDDTRSPSPITRPYYAGDSLHGANSMDSQHDHPDDDYYPLDAQSGDEHGDHAMVLSGEVVVHWEQHLFDDDEGYPAGVRQAIVDGRLHVPRVLTTTAMVSGEVVVEASGGGGGGFGAVPASAAAIAGLEKQTYRSSDRECVICMKEYEAGSELSVMPCEHKHRFHRRCLAEWLARSNLCPLCRHALPRDEPRAHKRQRIL